MVYAPYGHYGHKWPDKNAYDKELNWYNAFLKNVKTKKQKLRERLRKGFPLY